MREASKLGEAEYFLSEMARVYENHRLFQYNLSAFLSAARSVLQYACKEATSRPGGQAWYEKQVTDHRAWGCPGLVEGELLRCALLAHALPRVVRAMVGPFWGDREIAPPWPIVAPGGNAATDFSRDVVRTVPAT